MKLQAKSKSNYVYVQRIKSHLACRAPCGPVALVAWLVPPSSPCPVPCSERCLDTDVIGGVARGVTGKGRAVETDLQLTAPSTRAVLHDKASFIVVVVRHPCQLPVDRVLKRLNLSSRWSCQSSSRHGLCVYLLSQLVPLVEALNM